MFSYTDYAHLMQRIEEINIKLDMILQTIQIEEEEETDKEPQIKTKRKEVES